MVIPDKPHYGYYQAPCVNHCQQEVMHARELSNIHQQGAALKKKYIEAAKGQNNPNQVCDLFISWSYNQKDMGSMHKGGSSFTGATGALNHTREPSRL